MSGFRKEMLVILLILSAARLANTYSQLPLDSAVRYFKAANIGSVALFICSSQYEKVKTVRSLIAEGFSVGYTLQELVKTAQRTGALLDIACPFDFNAKRAWFIGQSVEWLVYGVSAEGSIDLLPALPDSSVTLLQDGILYDIYRPSLELPLRAANYTNGPRAHDDFAGIQLTAAQIRTGGSNLEEEDPEILFGDLECLNDNHGGWNTSLSIPILQNLAQSLNFSVKIVEPSARGCRALDQLLQSGTVHFSTPLMLTQSRLDFLEFSTHLFEVKNRILYKQPSLSAITNIYLLPFTREVWLACLGTFLLANLVMCFALRAGGAFEEHFVTPADMFTLVIGFVCQQGTELNPKSLTVRTTIVIFSLCALFLYTSYSANIVALLQGSSPTVASLNELADSPLSLALHDTLHNRISLQESKDIEIQELLAKKHVNEKSYISVEDGIKRIRDGSTAFGVETSRGYKLISKLFEEPEKCGLADLHVFRLPALSLPLVKMSGYREQFTRLLALEVECGLVARVKKQLIEDKPHCASMDSGYVSVGFADFKPALLVLGYGVAAAFIAVVLEAMAARIRLMDKHEQFEETEKRFQLNNIEIRAQKIVEEVFKLREQVENEEDLKEMANQCTHMSLDLMKPLEQIKKRPRKIEIRRANPQIQRDSEDQKTKVTIRSYLKDVLNKSKGNPEQRVMNHLQFSDSKEVTVKNKPCKSSARKNKSNSYQNKVINDVCNDFKPSKEDFEAAKKQAEDILKALKEDTKNAMTQERFLSSESESECDKTSKSLRHKKGSPDKKELCKPVKLTETRHSKRKAK